jgi:hypothetical protein
MAVRNGAAVSFMGRIHFMGGYTDSGPEIFKTSRFEYDDASDAWNRRAPTPRGRFNFVPAAAVNRIHAIGGDPVSDKNEAYDPAAVQQSRMPPIR